MVTAYLTNGTKISSFMVKVATVPNNALEGVTIDKRNHLFILNEKAPRLMLEYYRGQELARKEITAALDLSDIFYKEQANCLWIVSDESQKVLKLDMNGTVLSEYSIPFSKGEGITIVQNKLYIISDADGKLYVFQKPQ
ncbi:MAG: SdiA-regulated domain-containing protein [bacterium]